MQNVAYSAWLYKGKPYKMVSDEEVKLENGSISQLYTGWAGRTPETVDVYELMDGYNPGIPIVDEMPRPTANQLRAEIVEKAKAFVEKYLNACKSIFATHEGNGLLSEWGMSPKFEVNSEKRTVVALLYKTNGGTLVGKGIAKCMPSDVFNEHIGKAIALGRALGLDVSEFEQAVLPTHASGQECVIKNWEGHNGNKLKLKKPMCDGFTHDYGFGWLDINNLTIINDTNAQYGGVE